MNKIITRLLVALVVTFGGLKILEFLFPKNVRVDWNIETAIFIVILMSIFYWLGLTANRHSSKTKQSGNWYKI